MQILSFAIDSHRYGLASESVVEIVRAVAVTPLSGAPAVVEGIIDVRGTVVPVFDLRRRFGLATRPVVPADHFILARTTFCVAALHVDHVGDLLDVDDRDTSDPRQYVTAAPHIAGVAILPDGLVLIHDVETFLSHVEAETLDSALVGRDGVDDVTDASVDRS